jgi:hypothetical protein
MLLPLPFTTLAGARQAGVTLPAAYVYEPLLWHAGLSQDDVVAKVREAVFVTHLRTNCAGFKGGGCYWRRCPNVRAGTNGPRMNDAMYKQAGLFNRGAGLPLVVGIATNAAALQIEDWTMGELELFAPYCVNVVAANIGDNVYKSKTPEHKGRGDSGCVYLAAVDQGLVTMKQYKKIMVPVPQYGRAAEPQTAEQAEEQAAERTAARKRARTCSSCAATFKHPCGLNVHVRTVHEQRRDHACPQCEAAFGEACNLRVHVRTVHEQRRDHACSQCAAAFGEAGHLRTHVRTVHEQRKDHACPLCDAAFGRGSSLKKHVRTVHEKRRDHACPKCDAAFGEAGHLKRHERTVHKKRKFS